MRLSTEHLSSPCCEHASILPFLCIACLRENRIGLANSFMESYRMALSQTEVMGWLVTLSCHSRCQAYVSGSSSHVFRPSFFITVVVF